MSTARHEARGRCGADARGPHCRIHRLRRHPPHRAEGRSIGRGRGGAGMGRLPGRCRAGQRRPPGRSLAGRSFSRSAGASPSRGRSRMPTAARPRQATATRSSATADRWRGRGSRSWWPKAARLDAISQLTGAGTVCGGCGPLIGEIAGRSTHAAGAPGRARKRLDSVHSRFTFAVDGPGGARPARRERGAAGPRSTGGAITPQL